MEEQNQTITQPSQPIPQTQSKNPLNIKLIILTIVILYAILAGFSLVYYKNHKTLPKSALVSQLNKNQFSGQIIFANKQGLNSLDPKTGKINFLFDGGGFTWTYQNNYIFVSSSSAIVRFSLSTHEKDSLSITNMGSSEIIPSPNGQKVYVLNHPGYPADPTPPEIFVYDFSTKTRQYLPSGTGLYKWFPDGIHAIIVANYKTPTIELGGQPEPSLKIELYNLTTGSQNFIYEGSIGSMAISQNGNTLLWYGNIVGNNAPITRERPQPVLYSTTINLDTDSIAPVASISGSKFPINLDTYSGGGIIDKGFSVNTVFMTVTENKDNGIYTINTDNGEIRKIISNPSFDYLMQTYNPSLNEVLAYKYPDKMYPLNFPPWQARAYQYKPYVVLLNTNGTNIEKIITKLDGLVPDMPFIFSPDNQFILGPKYSDQDSDSEFTIFSLQNPTQSYVLKTDLGRQFYWIK